MLAGCGIGCASKKNVARPNVLILVLDTLRRDRMSCYGYRRDTTPFIDSLIPETAFYKNAYSVANWTLPAHASLFTGLYPGTHGTHFENVFLDVSIPTLGEALQRGGYRTFAISENFFVGSYTGLSRGFDVFVPREIYHAPSTLSRDDPVHGHLATFLDTDENKPFFCFINLMACHKPYNRSGDCFGMYLSDPAYRNRYDYNLWSKLAQKNLDREWLLHLNEHYDACVRHADQLVEAIMGVLKKHGLLDSTMIVVTSDHGENLGDHGLLGHDLCLYETLVSIPLLIRFPEGHRAGETVKRPVQLVDIPPTVEEMTHVPLLISNCPGDSLYSGMGAEDRPLFLEAYQNAFFGKLRKFPGAKLPPPQILNNPRILKYDRRLKSVVRTDLGLKLITGSDGSREVYDVAKDPDESQPVENVANYGPQIGELDSALQDAISRFCTKSVSEKTQIKQETIHLMKAMGYL